MKRKKKKSEQEIRTQHRHAIHDMEGAGAGAMAGALLGVAAGPPGMIAGAVFGAMAGGMAAAAMDSAAERDAAHTEELDKEIGVMGGDLGAPNLKHPPATVGAYSSAATGVSATSGETADGPIPPPEE